MSTEDTELPDMVGKVRGAHPMPEMTLFGYIIAALMIPVLLPLVPFVLLYIAYAKVAKAVTG